MTGTPEPWRTTPCRRGGNRGGATLWLVHAFGDSSSVFGALLQSSLASEFELLAPDWPGAGAAPTDAQTSDLDVVAEWLARTIDRETPSGRVGLVGHSLGAAMTVRVVSRLRRVVGLFSIEGNLTAADAYLSGLAAAFETPEDYRRHLLARVGAMAQAAAPGRGDALWHYQRSLGVWRPETLWRIGRSAAAASSLDALGEEYRALPIPTVYYWSRENTPGETREYLQKHGLRNVEFAGAHWPMIEQPQATADTIAAFFRPLFLAREEAQPV